MRFVVTLMLCLLAAASAVALPTDRDEFIVYRARRVFGGLRMQPIDSQAAVRQAIEQGSVEVVGSPMSEAQHGALLDAAAEFVFLQGQANAQEYALWREQGGSRLIGRDLMISEHAADLVYEEAAGQALPAETADARVFEAIWTSARTRANGHSHIVGVAIDPQATVIAVKHTDARDASWPYPKNGVAPIAGYGNSSGFSRRWWTRDPTLETRLAAGETVLDGLVVVIVQMHDGLRLPLGMRFIFDEAAAQWRLDNAVFWFHQAQSNKQQAYDLVIEF